MDPFIVLLGVYIALAIVIIALPWFLWVRASRKLQRLRELYDPKAVSRDLGESDLDLESGESVGRFLGFVIMRTARTREILGIKNNGHQPRKGVKV